MAFPISNTPQPSAPPVPVSNYGSVPNNNITMHRMEEPYHHHEDTCCCPCLCCCTTICKVETYKLLFYQILNLILGSFASSLLPVLVIIGVLTTPLCGVGLVILQGVLYLLQILSILEAHIYNFMASPSDQILLHMTFPEASHIRTGWQFSSGLGAWTCESCKAVFYFAFIKYPIFCFSASLSIGLWSLSIICILAPFAPDAACLVHTDTDICYQADMITRLCISVMGFFLLYLSTKIMRMCTNISMKITRFCLCGYYTTIVQTYISQPHSYEVVVGHISIV